MDMKLDIILIKSERQKRAWSQEHLADVSGLGLRTIQRIERNGVASYESIRALAAVFSLRIADLAVMPDQKQQRINMGRAAAGFVATLLMATSAIIFTSDSWAEQVMLEVGISPNDEEMIEGRLLTAEGKEAEMRINDIVRVVIVPRIQDDGNVFLSARIYEIVDGEALLLSEPKLITANNKEAEIRIEGESGNLFRVLITPHTNDSES